MVESDNAHENKEKDEEGNKNIVQVMDVEESEPNLKDDQMDTDEKEEEKISQGNSLERKSSTSSESSEDTCGDEEDKQKEQGEQEIPSMLDEVPEDDTKQMEEVATGVEDASDESSMDGKGDNESVDDNIANDQSSEEDSEPAPVLVQEEPPKSVDSNVASIDTAPPTLSPNDRRSSKDSQEDFSMEEYEPDDRSMSEDDSESDENFEESPDNELVYDSDVEMAEEANSKDGEVDDKSTSSSLSPAPPTLSPEQELAPTSPPMEEEKEEGNQNTHDEEDEEESQEENDEEEQEEKSNGQSGPEDVDYNDQDSSESLSLADIDPSILPSNLLSSSPRKDAVSTFSPSVFVHHHLHRFPSPPPWPTRTGLPLAT